MLGPVHFTLYTLPLRNIIRHHGTNFHCYDDDPQLCLSVNPKSEQLVKLQACLDIDTKSWMTSNCLLLNPDKSKVIVFGPYPLRDRLDYIFTVGQWSQTQITWGPQEAESG